MSRTFRHKHPRQDKWADDIDISTISPRLAKRLRKGADGVLQSSICGSTVEGVYNNWDDVAPNKEIKRLTHKDIRRHNKALVKAGLKESNDED